MSVPYDCSKKVFKLRLALAKGFWRGCCATVLMGPYATAFRGHGAAAFDVGSMEETK